jgi:rhodanese-related sulfurtransferase
MSPVRRRKETGVKNRTAFGVYVLISFAALLSSGSSLWGQDNAGGETKVPEHKRTTLGLYMTSPEALEKWRSDRENTKIIDVRTPEEYIYVGHAPMAYNVPLKFLEYGWDAEKKKPVMRTNTDFVDQVKKIAQPSDTVLVTCRSGQRSTPAVNLLAAAGYRKVVNVIDGFEGDKVSDPENVFQGQRMKNGWRNSGLPWTYELDPKLMHLE